MKNRDGFEDRYVAWLEQFKTWCKRHDITIKQGYSILFNDSPYHGKTRKDLYWCEVDDFNHRLAKELFKKEERCLN